MGVSCRRRRALLYLRDKATVFTGTFGALAIMTAGVVVSLGSSISAHDATRTCIQRLLNFPIYFCFRRLFLRVISPPPSRVDSIADTTGEVSFFPPR